jgi:hypothetical protein
MRITIVGTRPVGSVTAGGALRLRTADTAEARGVLPRQVIEGMPSSRTWPPL